MKEQKWFEFVDLRARTLDRAAWIPLRAMRKTKNGPDMYEHGYEEEFFGAASAAFPLDQRDLVKGAVSWSNLGLMHDHGPSIQDGRYIPADVFEAAEEGPRGTYLVLSQPGNSLDHGDWIVHPDLILALALKREGDEWLAMNEGYVPVIRMHRNGAGAPDLVEIRAEHLKDFLAARGEFLTISTYRSREFISRDRPQFSWPGNCEERTIDGSRWMGTITAINEHGFEYGSSFAVFHVGRANFDTEQDLPSVGHTDEFTTRQLSGTYRGSLRHRVWGELWRLEFLQPGSHSPRIRYDKVPSSIFFYTDTSGTRESAETLYSGGRWLWFKPDVINKALEFRGSSLEWYTADTGRVRMGPDSGVVFGVNSLGLVNVYAKDIGYSNPWQQQIWAGFNAVPDGGVSRELLMSQAEGEPARTTAPETLLRTGINDLNAAGKEAWGFELIRPHKDYEGLIASVHRFRAITEHGVFSLAKDLARLTADSFDVAGLQRIQAPPKGVKLGSLKSLQGVLETIMGKERAHRVLSPLFGAYDLRLADAHLPGSELDDAYADLEIDRMQPPVRQGAQMISAVARALGRIAEAIKSSKSNG